MVAVEEDSRSPIFCNFAEPFKRLHQTVEYSKTIHYPLPSVQEIVVRKIQMFPIQEIATVTHKLCKDFTLDIVSIKLIPVLYWFLYRCSSVFVRL
ncbi:hypothetical protein TNCV_1393511 [Trichonephila clavipes]|nr:hypothetical protein TNCV_1393511 [Trichonephila clavipes]